MNKKTAAVLTRIILISFIMLFSTAAISSATIYTWTNTAGDANWNTNTNWSGNVVPNTTSDYAKINMASGPVFTGQTATAYRVNLEGNGILTMSSGNLTTNNHIYVGALAADTATFLNMSGGTINITGNINGTSTLWVGRDAGGNGTVNLSGGTITCNALSMRLSGGTGIINITNNGKLIINGNVLATIVPYITSGWIEAYSGAGSVGYDYNVTTPGKTTVWANTKAANPSPDNNTVDVAPNANLGWTAGPGVISHNVYFGTSSSPALVSSQTAITFNPGILDFNTTYYWRIDEVTGSGTITGDLWKFSTVSGLAETPNPVDEEMNVALNKVLSWTSGYGAASHDIYLGTSKSDVTNAERPEGDLDKNGRVDYNDLLILTNHWLQNPAGSEPYAGVNDDNIVDFRDYALLAKNWMGQASSSFRGNTTDTSYDDPCDFAINTTYYWRVDEVSGSKIMKGDVWKFTTIPDDSSYSLVGKVMCGYQGWFNCPDDGSNRGWVHWGNGNFSPVSCAVDMWPDMTEYGADEKFLAPAFYDGVDHYVFSPYKRNTVLRHFQWMQLYGIDGVFLQRFGTEVIPGSLQFLDRNAVLSHCRDGANMYGKKYAVMYDLSDLQAGNVVETIENDWKYLVDTMHINRDPCDYGCMKHKGKPVVAVWGIGWIDTKHPYSFAECRTLVNFLKDDPTYGGNTVMIGVKDNWRSKYLVSSPNSVMQDIVAKADIISPWTVGSYSSGGVNSYASSKWLPDKQWCNNHVKDYLPVIWPGYSFYNSSGHAKKLNEKPRFGGQFLWDQVKATISTVGVSMIYVAMFDEVDEGTAIFKVTNDPPVTAPNEAKFVVYRQDVLQPDGTFLPTGDPLPSDEYLWLTGQAGMALRGEISPVPSTRPVRP